MDVEKFKAFKEAVKEGCSIRQALEKSGMSRGAYDYYYNQIWSDPELEPYKPKLSQKKVEEKPPEPETGKPPEQKAKSPVQESEERLKEYIGGETEFEREWNETKMKEAQMLKAAMKIVGMSMEPGGPSATVPETEEKKAERRYALEEFEEAFKDFEERRAKIRETLEKMGFKVEDRYMTRDEVEKLLAEREKKVLEEGLDDKRIEAIKDIVNNAVSQVVGLFKPAVDIMFSSTPKPPAQAQVVEAPKLEGGEERKKSEGESASQQSSA